MSQQEVKPDVASGGAGEGGAGDGGGGDEYLTLKVVGQDGAQVQFKTKKTTALKKLMRAYCERMNIQAEHTRFVFDGTRILPEQTPSALGLEDGDQIDAMVEQLGGKGRERV